MLCCMYRYTHTHTQLRLHTAPCTSAPASLRKRSLSHKRPHPILLFVNGHRQSSAIGISHYKLIRSSRVKSCHGGAVVCIGGLDAHPQFVTRCPRLVRDAHVILPVTTVTIHTSSHTSVFMIRVIVIYIEGHMYACVENKRKGGQKTVYLNAWSHCL